MMAAEESKRCMGSIPEQKFSILRFFVLLGNIIDWIGWKAFEKYIYLQYLMDIPNWIREKASNEKQTENVIIDMTPYTSSGSDSVPHYKTNKVTRINSNKERSDHGFPID
jgi:hypothetical protein